MEAAVISFNGNTSYGIIGGALRVAPRPFPTPDEFFIFYFFLVRCCGFVIFCVGVFAFFVVSPFCPSSLNTGIFSSLFFFGLFFCFLSVLFGLFISFFCVLSLVCFRVFVFCLFVCRLVLFSYPSPGQ